jgi:glutamate racemase
LSPDNRPIGIFDSGIGGLTIARSVSELMPNEQILFFGDTAHLPYGDKSAEAIKSYVSRIADFFIENDCKMILLACNSASAAAYPLLHKLHSSTHPVLNVIDPNVEYVCKKGHSTIGVIGTKATVSSRTYNRKFAASNPELKVKSMATPLLAPMIEEGYFNNNISQTIINSYLSNKKLSGIDALVLACTHYPLIKKEIETYFANQKSKVEIIDSTDVVAAYVKKYIHNKKMSALIGRVPEHQFCVSDFTTSFQKTTNIFYGEAVKLTHIPIWEMLK